jgi:hypothetical protein
MMAAKSDSHSSAPTLSQNHPKSTVLFLYFYFNDSLGTGVEQQICTLSARGFELTTFRLLVQRSDH